MDRPYKKYTVLKNRKPATDYARGNPWTVYRPHPFYAGDLVGSFATQPEAFRFARRLASNKIIDEMFS